jgi:hypothetical protein
MEIPFRCPDVGMTHQRLDGFQAIPIIQEGRGERMPHDMRINPLLDQCLFTTDLMRQSTLLWVSPLS